MVEIIRLHGDPHHQAQTLLPWYANGSLEADEAAAVEAHLADCADCRVEFALERALAARVADLPADVEQGWAKLRGRVRAKPAWRPAWTPSWPPAPAGAAAALLARPVAIGWALAAQAAALAAAVCLGLAWQAAWQARQPERAPQPLYHALGAAPASGRGDLVVVFKPTASLEAFRAALDASGARLVDGPTSTGAYVLQSPADDHGQALALLRADGQVLLAEPIDGDARR
jgi:anti-sigma factor RsiW